MGIKGSYPHCPQGWKAGAGSIHFFRCICYYMRTGNDGTGKDKMTYKDSFKIDVTLVANEFLDKYMPGANGDYVKVYLYVLRNGRRGLDVAEAAEKLELTEGDVRRAMKYWEELGIFCPADKEQAPSAEQPGRASARSAKAAETKESAAAEDDKTQKASASDVRSRYRSLSGKEALDRLSGDAEFSQLLFVVQKYMSKILSNTDQQVFAYLYDGLHMPCEVIDYLVDYCVQQGKNNIKYIEAVGLDWVNSGIKDVEAAKQRTREFEERSSGTKKRSARKQASQGQRRGTDYDSIVFDKVIGRKQS